MNGAEGRTDIISRFKVVNRVMKVRHLHWYDNVYALKFAPIRHFGDCLGDGAQEVLI